MKKKKTSRGDHHPVHRFTVGVTRYKTHEFHVEASCEQGAIETAIAEFERPNADPASCVQEERWYVSALLGFIVGIAGAEGKSAQ